MFSKTAGDLGTGRSVEPTRTPIRPDEKEARVWVRACLGRRSHEAYLDVLRPIFLLLDDKPEDMPHQGLTKLATRVPDVVLLEGGSCALAACKPEKLAPGAALAERRDAPERVEESVPDVSEHGIIRKDPTVDGASSRAAQAPSVHHRTMDPFA